MPPFCFLEKRSPFDAIPRALCDQVEQVNPEWALDEKRILFILGPRPIFFFLFRRKLTEGATDSPRWFCGATRQQSRRTGMRSCAQGAMVCFAPVRAHACVCLCGQTVYELESVAL